MNNLGVAAFPYRIVKVGCPLCDSDIAIFDLHHSEISCKRCGCVIAQSIPNSHAEYNHPNTEPEDYTHISNRKKYQVRTTKNHGDKKVWKKEQDYRYITVIHTNLELTKYQKSRAKYIIKHIDDFRKLGGNNHLPINREQVITSICILLMRLDGNIFRIDNHPFCKNINLTSERFCKVIYKLQGSYGFILTERENQYMEGYNVSK